jgi:hypothetical protein
MCVMGSCRSEKENIPTIIELIDDSAVIEALAQEAASHWNTNSPRLINPSEDPAEEAFEREVLRRSNEEFGRQQADKVRMNLPKTIGDARSIIASSILEVIMNLRDKHLAHSLSQTRREQRAGPIDPMKYGDEKKILEETFPIVEALYLYVNGTSFSFEDSRKIDRKNAEALWKACTFQITR